MSQEKIEKAFNLVGKGLNILTALGCIFVVGVVAYVVFGIMEYTGAIHILLTGVVAVFGGLVLNLILRILVNFSSF